MYFNNVSLRERLIVMVGHLNKNRTFIIPRHFMYIQFHSYWLSILLSIRCSALPLTCEVIITNVIWKK